MTWLGHSTILLEIDGHRFLTDPVWSERIGPIGSAGPKRWFPPPLALGDLPPLDAVVLSHDHYDHLDYATIVALQDRNLLFVAPLGVGAHLERWGVPAAKIVELDWWESHAFGDLVLRATPARHASGRVLIFDDGAKLWAGCAFLGARHRVYYSGDTGLFPGLRTIGERLGPFDLTMAQAPPNATPNERIGRNKTAPTVSGTPECRSIRFATLRPIKNASRENGSC